MNLSMRVILFLAAIFMVLGTESSWPGEPATRPMTASPSQMLHHLKAVTGTTA